MQRFLSVDPLAPDYPWYTPYQFAGNMPIWAVDVDGLEPDATTGEINGNFIFSLGENSTLSMDELSNLACDFESNCIYVWNEQEFNGNQVDVGVNSTYTTDGQEANQDYINIQVIVSDLGKGAPSYADRENSKIYINERDWDPVGGFKGNVASHEFGHLWGLSDRYLDGGSFSRDEFEYTRTTVPLILGRAIDSPIDPEYDYLNNLYSTGSSTITTFQLDIVFSQGTEAKWSKGYVGFYLGGNTQNKPGLVFDGVRVKGLNQFNFYSNYKPVIGNNLSGLKGDMKSGNIGFYAPDGLKSNWRLIPFLNDTYFKDYIKSKIPRH